MSNLSTKNMKLCCMEQNADFHAITAAIVLGDFGLPWSSDCTVDEAGIHPADHTDRYLLKWYNQKPFKILAVMGNHDNYDIIEKLPEIEMFGAKVLKVSDNVFYLKILIAGYFNSVFRKAEGCIAVFRGEFKCAFVFFGFLKAHIPAIKCGFIRVSQECTRADVVSAEQIAVNNGQGFVYCKGFLADRKLKRVFNALVKNMKIAYSENAVFGIKIYSVVF